MNLKYVIKKPIVTEKSMAAAKRNSYTFLVDRNANKDQIKTALKQYYEVDVISINTIIMPGSTKRTGRRYLKSTSAPTKKAIIQLKEGQSIAAIENQG